MDAFKSMERQGIQPDVVAHNAAITACAKVRCNAGCVGGGLLRVHQTSLQNRGRSGGVGCSTCV